MRRTFDPQIIACFNRDLFAVLNLMKIPDDVYQRVFELSTDLINASEAEDTRDYWRIYSELRGYCEEQAQSDRDHPFLWETLADFTDDSRVAIGLYERALGHAERVNAASYEASIKFALAERYKALGDSQQAYDYALAANEKAKSLDDLDLRKQISEFLLNESKKD